MDARVARNPAVPGESGCCFAPRSPRRLAMPSANCASLILSRGKVTPGTLEHLQFMAGQVLLRARLGRRPVTRAPVE